MINAPLVAFYGDDFTGAVANLAEFDALGLRGMLLPTTPAGDVDLAGYDVVGIAGTARSLAGSAFDDEVAPALRFLHGLRPRVLQYKLCSTFDSSPRVGNLGRVIELAHAEFGFRTFPVVPADPGFGRYTVFGNHFANDNGEVVRLDRHPTMSVHPSTPMSEADLRRHLAAQTTMLVDTIDWRTVRAGASAVHRTWRNAQRSQPSAVVLDTLTDGDLTALGLFLWQLAADEPTLVLGSQGIARGLARAAVEGRTTASAGPADQAGAAAEGRGVLVLSGSASPQSAAQIEAALAAGWLGIECDVPAVVDATHRLRWSRDTAMRICAALGSGRHVVAYSTIGKPASAASTSPEDVSAAIGSAYADCLRQVMDAAPVQRLVVAGGDTSSHFVRSLGVGRLEIARNAVVDGLSQLKAVPDGRLSGSGLSRLGSLELFLKAGQAGSAELYLKIAGITD